jgi:hypothetical protein
LPSPTSHQGNLPIIVLLRSSIFPICINPFVSTPVAQHRQRVHDARVPSRGGGARSREAVVVEDWKGRRRRRRPSVFSDRLRCRAGSTPPQPPLAHQALHL